MTDHDATDPTIDSLGAFVPGGLFQISGTEGGPLAGLSFAAKDLFDIEGFVTGCGNPDWAATHGPAQKTAPVVRTLLDAGATLLGKTVTDELAYSLNGQNFHYGTPTNSNAPGRIPGGSSSGSAAAVAGGLVDFAIGTDTGGSIRIPASYCGLFGLRPSHGRISAQGVMPLAESFDTVGWFAREASILRRIGNVLFQDPSPQTVQPSQLLLARDTFEILSSEANARLTPVIGHLEARLGKGTAVEVTPLGGGLEALMLTFRTLQAREIWAQHGDWITSTKPTFGPEIAERFAWVQSITDEQAEAARPERAQFTRALEELLPIGSVLCLPTAPGIAPRCDASAASLRQHRSQTLGLTAIAGLAGLPQITLPLADFQGCPLGLSLMAAKGQDMALLAFAESFLSGIERAGGNWES